MNKRPLAFRTIQKKIDEIADIPVFSLYSSLRYCSILSMANVISCIFLWIFLIDIGWLTAIRSSQSGILQLCCLKNSLFFQLFFALDNIRNEYHINYHRFKCHESINLLKFLTRSIARSALQRTRTCRVDAGRARGSDWLPHHRGTAPQCPGLAIAGTVDAHQTPCRGHRREGSPVMGNCHFPVIFCNLYIPHYHSHSLLPQHSTRVHIFPKKFRTIFFRYCDSVMFQKGLNSCGDEELLIAGACAVQFNYSVNYLA